MKQGGSARILSIVLSLLAICFGAQAAEEPGRGEDTLGNSSGSQGEAKNADPPDAKELAKARVFAEISTLDDTGFTRLGPPQPGEWLAIHDEPPQTLHKYKMSLRVRPTPNRRTIVLQPLIRPGADDLHLKKVLGPLRDYAEAHFQLPVRIAEPLELKLADEQKQIFRIIPVGNRHGAYDRQFCGDLIMDELLVKKLPTDAVLYMGVTMEDLWTQQSIWVFGLGSLDKRVGVFSLARFYPEFWGQERKEADEIVALRRGCRVMSHEAGHILGLSHCIFYRCKMNGAYSLAEADATPMHECPLCHRKLLWNIGFEPAQRFAALQGFFEKNKLSPEAEWMSARIKNWKRMQEKERAPGEE